MFQKRKNETGVQRNASDARQIVWHFDKNSKNSRFIGRDIKGFATGVYILDSLFQNI